MAQRVIVVARGDLFSVPMKEGTPRNLTQDLQRARARRGLVAGRQMDRLQLRRDRRERALRPLAGWQRPAATDNQQRRYLLLSSRSGRPTARSCSGAIVCSGCVMSMSPAKPSRRSIRIRKARFDPYDWSPDSQWIAWSRPEENGLPKVYLFSTADKKQTAVTDDWYSAGNVDLQRRRQVSDA